MDTTSLSLRLSTLAHIVGTSTEGAVLARLRTVAGALDDVPDASVRFLVQHWPEYDAHLQPLPPPAVDAQHAVHALQLHEELATAYREISEIAALQAVLDGTANKALAKSMDASRLHIAKQQETEQDEQARVIHQRVLHLVTNWANYTTSVSHAFILLDTQLATLERRLTHLERS